MRTSLLVLASLLLLLLAARAHGIRLDRQLHEAINNKKEMGDSKVGQPSNTAHSMDKHCTSVGDCSGTMEQTTPTTVVVKDREVASAYERPVPRFHEDYYGPSGHEPNHH